MSRDDKPLTERRFVHLCVVMLVAYLVGKTLWQILERFLP